MHLSLAARVLWATGFIELVALFAVLLVRGRWKSFPFFTAWIGFQAVRTILLFCIYRYSTHSVYAAVYWSAAVVELGLQIGVVFDLSRIVLKPTGTWVRDARNMFIVLAVVGTLVAAAAAYAVNPTLPTTKDDWIEKGNLFAGMLVALLFLAMGLASTRLGIAWRHHVMGIATGWTLWAGAGLFVEAAYSYFGASWHGVVLDDIEILAFQAATLYWIVILWLPEPETRTLSHDMQSYLLGLQQHLELGVQGIRKLDRH